MVRSRVFVFLAVTLCLVACLCAQATVSEAEAIKSVHDAERTIVKVIKMTEYELKEAQNVKRDMEWYEEKAQKRVSKAAEAAQAAVEAAEAALVAASNNNRDPAVQAARTKRYAAQTVATNQKNNLQNARNAYPNAKADADRAIQSLNDVISKARKLDEKEEIQKLFVPDSPIDYSKVKEIALSIKRQAEALKEEIKNATKLLSSAESIISLLPAPTTEELIKKYKADGLAAGSVFQTIVDEAENIVLNIEYQKNQVKQSVETIKNIFKKNPGKVSPLLNGFLTTAQSDLVTIAQMVNEAHTSKKYIINWKKHAQGSNKTLNEATDDRTAKTQLRHIKYYADNSAWALENIKETLISARHSVRNAQNQVESTAEEILKNNGTLKSTVTATTQKPKRVVRHKARKPAKKEDKGKTQQKTEEHTATAAEISTSQKSEREANHNKETPVKETTAKLINNNAVQLSDQQNQEEPAEGKRTRPTNKSVKVPTDNKPDQLPGEKITKPTSNAAEGQTVNKPEQSAEGNTELLQKYTTVKPTKINPEKEITGTSQNSAHQASDKPEMEKTVQKKEQKLEKLHLAKLRKGAKNITKIPFFGENFSASDAWSDGSMIVCVPLLAALIASAVLH